MAVYLLMRGKGSESWVPVGDRVFFSERIIAGGAPAPGHEPWFVVTPRADGCAIEWLSRTPPSPLPGAVARGELQHGDTFDVADSRFLVYVEPDNAAWDSPPDDRAAAALARLSDAELQHAARCFLGLPHAAYWWSDAFARATGFVQYRDGRVPAVRAWTAAKAPGGAELRWEVAVWDLSRSAWAPNRERAEFTRGVFGDDLARLVECATMLRDSPPDDGSGGAGTEPIARCPPRLRR